MRYFRLNVGLFFLLATTMFLHGCSNRLPVGERYYVSAKGDDRNPGTEARPFKTILKVNTLQPKAGDQILFKGGEVFNGSLSLRIYGKPGKPVIISSYGEKPAIINGGVKEAIILQGTNFHLKFISAMGAGRNTGSNRPGIYLDGASDAVVEQIEVFGFQKSGLEIHSCRNIEIRNVTAGSNGFCGILVSGSMKNRSKNILIKDCSAVNNSGDPTELNNHSGNGILVGMSDSVVIDHCTAANNGWDMPRIGNGPVGIWAYESDHVTIQYCISFRNRTSKGGKDGGGFDLDGGVRNSVIQYCLSYENEGAGYGLFQYAGASLWYNNIVRYCVSVNDGAVTQGSGGLFVWNGSDDSLQLADCLVHNNVFCSVKSVPLRFEPKSLNKNFNFYNNIIYGAGKLIEGPSSGEKFGGNVWWSDSAKADFRGFKTLEQWSLHRKESPSDYNLDPHFQGQSVEAITDPYKLNTLFSFKLKESNLLQDLGIPLPPPWKFPGKDFFGTAVPQGVSPEPGIFEIRER